MEEKSYVQYLASKKAVDDRSINRLVAEELRSELSTLTPPIRILDLGGGLGTTVTRLLEWDLVTAGHCTVLDADPNTLSHSIGWLTSWAEATGYKTTFHGESIRITGKGRDMIVDLLLSELDAFLDRENQAAQFDLIVANAFMDLVDVPRILPRIVALCRPGAP